MIYICSGMNGFADLAGPMNLFQCNMSKSNWRQLLNDTSN